MLLFPSSSGGGGERNLAPGDEIVLPEEQRVESFFTNSQHKGMNFSFLASGVRARRAGKKRHPSPPPGEIICLEINYFIASALQQSAGE
jgi:hypothetical protein